VLQSNGRLSTNEQLVNRNQQSTAPGKLRLEGRGLIIKNGLVFFIVV